MPAPRIDGRLKSTGGGECAADFHFDRMVYFTFPHCPDWDMGEYSARGVGEIALA